MTMDRESQLAEAALRAPYQKCAAYFINSDCVEYVKDDCFCVYDRIDPYLTLVYDETMLTVVGFKLKGFKHLFEKHLRPLFELNDMQFIDLVPAIEMVLSKVGDKIFFGDQRRVAAYKAAVRLAANDNVRLSGFKLAA